MMKYIENSDLISDVVIINKNLELQYESLFFVVNFLKME